MAKKHPTMDRSLYEAELLRLQAELVEMQEWVRATGARVVVIFEGRDAAVALDQTASGENGFESHQPATFLIHWSIATAEMMRTPIRR